MKYEDIIMYCETQNLIFDGVDFTDLFWSMVE